MADTKEKAIQDMLKVRSSADLIEIRLDYINDLSDEGLNEILAKKPLPLIATCRKKEDGGKYKGSEEERVEILKKCINASADYVDIELSTNKESINEIIKNKKDSQVIVSYHNFKELPADLEEIYNQIKSTNCDILKIACMANSLRDNLKIFKLIKKAKKENNNIIGLCMGEKGEISRVLNVAHGSYLTFGYLEKGKESAPGQISCEFLKRVFRADKLNLDNLKIYGLVGYPISESRGFIVHNLVFKENKMNAVYLNFLVDDLKEFVQDFRPMISGLSITMPYKQEIMQYLDEINPIAKKINAVNTVIIKKGKLIGMNTDFEGAIEAIEKKTRIKGRNIVMLGAGGVARAIGYGIVMNGGNLIVVNRTIEKGKNLASELGAQFKIIDDIKWEDIDILINSTSVGMAPNLDKSPLGKGCLKNMVVFDSIYNPLITKLLDQSEKNGCTIISGIKMFINQAAKQFELWTNKQPDKEFMEQKILEYVAA